ncbi:uncharacterized protein STEHIDRAFT_123206 [Stereum hirsutum FP-91666 SS1]|uniref:uncharacterized protein n=1 Tax=Stereum hirsutum (strain FP-91666) TaxID=721885 RepID=UPI0004449D3F|nr:uncharacterized protein STEHIDRAFT_123206 [Stereum hirsutum FP-91666 SS1]EIM84399.1 hypothetical protein STEHIDRAFT_123206 [Stereum hirsutum FP-91666 SS1]
MLSSVAPRRISAITFGAKRFTSSFKEGSTASSKEFGKKEKAHEDQYIHQHEAEKLKKLRAEFEAKKAELEAQEKKVSEKK